MSCTSSERRIYVQFTFCDQVFKAWIFLLSNIGACDEDFNMRIHYESNAFKPLRNPSEKKKG